MPEGDMSPSRRGAAPSGGRRDGEIIAHPLCLIQPPDGWRLQAWITQRDAHASHSGRLHVASCEPSHHSWASLGAARPSSSRDRVWQATNRSAQAKGHPPRHGTSPSRRTLAQLSEHPPRISLVYSHTSGAPDGPRSMIQNAQHHVVRRARARDPHSRPCAASRVVRCI
jgi:hypothetical protein